MHNEWRFRRRAGSCKCLTLWALLLLAPGLALAQDDKPFFFIQLTDPQFGFFAQNASFEQETVNFGKAVAAANRLKPAFVVVTGDLVHKMSDAAQVQEYLRIAGTLDKSIRLYNVSGNHDVGNEPTPQSIAAYTAIFGADHYAFREGSFAGIVLNSSLMRSPGKAPEQFAQQESWLKEQLQKAKAEKARHIVIFQHHPVFLKSVDEPPDYHNFPLTQRRPYLQLLHDYNVRHIFAGHLHRNQLGNDGGLELVASGPVGKPLGKESRSGLRIVIVRDRGIAHQYYELDKAPDRVDLLAPAAAASR